MQSRKHLADLALIIKNHELPEVDKLSEVKRLIALIPNGINELVIDIDNTKTTEKIEKNGNPELKSERIVTETELETYRIVEEKGETRHYWNTRQKTYLLHLAAKAWALADTSDQRTTALKVVELLIKSGAQLNLRDQYGRTELCWAVSGFIFHGDRNDLSLFDLLKEKGADFDVRTTEQSLLAFGNCLTVHKDSSLLHIAVAGGIFGVQHLFAEQSVLGDLADYVHRSSLCKLRTNYDWDNRARVLSDALKSSIEKSRSMQGKPLGNLEMNSFYDKMQKSYKKGESTYFSKLTFIDRFQVITKFLLKNVSAEAQQKPSTASEKSSDSDKTKVFPQGLGYLWHKTAEEDVVTGNMPDIHAYIYHTSRDANGKVVAWFPPDLVDTFQDFFKQIKSLVAQGEADRLYQANRAPASDLAAREVKLEKITPTPDVVAASRVPNPLDSFAQNLLGQGSAITKATSAAVAALQVPNQQAALPNLVEPASEAKKATAVVPVALQAPSQQAAIAPKLVEQASAAKKATPDVPVALQAPNQQAAKAPDLVQQVIKPHPPLLPKIQPVSSPVKSNKNNKEKKNKTAPSITQPATHAASTEGMQAKKVVKIDEVKKDKPIAASSHAKASVALSSAAAAPPAPVATPKPQEKKTDSAPTAQQQATKNAVVLNNLFPAPSSDQAKREAEKKRKMEEMRQRILQQQRELEALMADGASEEPDSTSNLNPR